jgi:hypothetical protein
MSQLMRLLALATRSGARAVRRRLEARGGIACESLEGRQLLSFGGWGRPDFGGFGRSAEFGGMMGGGSSGPVMVTMPMMGGFGGGYANRGYAVGPMAMGGGSSGPVMVAMPAMGGFGGGSFAGPMAMGWGGGSWAGPAGSQGSGTSPAESIAAAMPTSGPQSLGLGTGPVELGGLPATVLGNGATIVSHGGGGLRAVAIRGHRGHGSSTDQTAVQTLNSDIDNLLTNSQVTLGQQHTLSKDLKAVLKAETGQPDAAKVTTLNDDTQAAIADGLTDADLTKIQADQAAVLQSAGVPQATITKFQTDALAVYKASGVTGAVVQKLQTDLTAIRSASDSSTSSTSSSTSSTTTTPTPATTTSTTTPATTTSTDPTMTTTS